MVVELPVVEQCNCRMLHIFFLTYRSLRRQIEVLQSLCRKEFKEASQPDTMTGEVMLWSWHAMLKRRDVLGEH
jgi:hypothetical protein